MKHRKIFKRFLKVRNMKKMDRFRKFKCLLDSGTIINKTKRLSDKNSYAITRGHDFVEINGVKWATCNLGANSPDETGWLFAWGETICHSEGFEMDWNDYKYYDDYGYTKYNDEDRKLVLDPEDDAAHVLWGGKWRTPTEKEFLSLIQTPKFERRINLTNLGYWTSTRPGIWSNPTAMIGKGHFRRYLPIKLFTIRPVLDI